MPANGQSRRVLIAPIGLKHLGGATAVSAWAIQALREDYDVSVFAWHRINKRILAKVNGFFGTDLTMQDANWLMPHRLARKAVLKMPTPSALLHIHLNMLYLRGVLARDRYGRCDRHDERVRRRSARDPVRTLSVARNAQTGR